MCTFRCTLRSTLNCTDKGTFTCTIKYNVRCILFVTFLCIFSCSLKGILKFTFKCNITSTIECIFIGPSWPIERFVKIAKVFQSWQYVPSKMSDKILNKLLSLSCKSHYTIWNLWYWLEGTSLYEKCNGKFELQVV